MKKNNRIFSLGIIAITSPLILGADLISEKERIILLVLSLLLFTFRLFKLKELLRFTIFLSVFISIFLTSQFIFFKKVDFLLFQTVILLFFFFQNRRRELNNFSIGIICLAIVTFLLYILTNRVLLGFYLNFWIDLKRCFPVFLFCITYFILLPHLCIGGGGVSIAKSPWVSYFIGLFIFTIFLSFFNPGEGKGVALKKVEHNLGFFYKDMENWKRMGSSLRRGLVYEYLGLWSKAGNEFKKIIISSPEDIDAHYNLARSYAARRLCYEAMLEYRKVAELDPYYHGSHYGLALTYERLGEIKKAEEEFLKEIEINPKEIKAYLALEELYRRQGLIREMERIRARRLDEITVSIDTKDISDSNMRILPVVLNGGPAIVEIVAKGTYAQGFWPRMEVWLSQAGRVVRGGDAFVKSNSWKSYYFHFKCLPGEEKLIVHFTNDFFGGVDNDRNLYIKQIKFIYGE